MSNQAALEEPLVAIVTPVYNGDYDGNGFLAEAMESVQRQTYRRIVHIVRDNASTDSTPEIIRKFEGRSKPLLTARAEFTSPMVENWNAALGMIPPDAKYFSILCADDLLHPNFCESLVALASKDPEVGIVGCRIERGGVVEDPNWRAGILDGREAIERCLLSRSALYAPHLLWSCDALDERRPFFCPHIVENDTEAALFVLLRRSFGFVDEPLAVSRLHGGSFTGKTYSETHDDFASWLQILTLIGRQALPPRKLSPLLFHYRMLHLRRMLQWRLLQGNRKAFDEHARIMRDLGFGVGPGDFALAMFEWTTKRLGLHRGHKGNPY